MSDDLIKNKFIEPNLIQILNYMDDYTRENYIKIANFFEIEYNATPIIMYSGCSAMPGWNIKFKKGSKSYCTLYPDKQYFTILLVIKESEIAEIMQQKSEYSNYFIDLINKSAAMNGCKWLMIGIDDDKIIEDIKKAIKLKYKK